MAIYTKKEFSELTKQATNYLSVQITRRKLVLNDEGKIDTTHEVNKAYLEKLYGRMDFVPDRMPGSKSKALKKPVPLVNNDDNDGDIEDGDDESMEALLANPDRKKYSYVELERIYKYLQGRKIERDMEKTTLEIEKRKGVLVPVEPVETLVFQFKQHLLTQQKITYEKFLSEIGHKYSITSEDLGYYRGYFIKSLNESMQEATNSFIEEMEATLNEFSIKRGVGERL